MMSATSLAKIIALAVVCGVLASAFATAPALWWLSEAEKAELIAKAEAQHGPEAAAYLRTITR
ncbi:MAG: hypothetical protein IJ164_02700 [Duodenibacillus sp.]|nr:hypothetical protein [Duodenibacillus sp.]